MKRIKRFSLVVILLVSSIAFSSVALALGDGPEDQYERDYNHQYQDRTRSGDCTHSAEAPLDGGLLAILAAAGIAYVGARKKRKNAE